MSLTSRLLQPLRRRPWWPRPGNGFDVETLLDEADARAVLPERHIWLIRLIDWIRRGEPVSGTQYVVGLLEKDSARRDRVVALLAAFWRDVDVAALLADYGFSPRASFLNELGERLRRQNLPLSPDTGDLAGLFHLLFDDPDDAQWLASLDTKTLTAIGKMWQEAREVRHEEAPTGPEQHLLGWREPFYDAMLYLATQVRAAGFSPAFRQRMGVRVDADFDVGELPVPDAREDGHTTARLAFRQIALVTDRVHELAVNHARDAGPDAPPPTALLHEASYLRALLVQCSQAASGLHGHLEAHGISVDLVFQIDQLRARCDRIERLLDVVLAPRPTQPLQGLLVDLVRLGERRRSVRALFRQHYSMLARKVAERSAETGEHYITRTRAEYRAMLGSAAGGGAVLAITTFLKFVVLAIGLSPFWTGMGAGLNYAISFVIVQLLHFTVATKQPAMTAPAMAARLADTRHDTAIEGFVDEVANLMRSQVAGIIGNLLLVAPVVIGLQALSWLALGRPLISAETAQHELENLTLLGPTLWYAAFTGVLLFTSSLMAGWVENWFVLYRLESALRWNPRIRAWLGEPRAGRWANWWRHNISGLAANISLGLMLGVVPVVAGFLALPLDVRHVTLSTGQLAAAAGTLGVGIVDHPAFWWCVAATLLTGVLNVGVSFFFALRVAIRSRGVKVQDRARLWAAIRRRLRHHPLSFLLPPRSAARPPSTGD